MQKKGAENQAEEPAALGKRAQRAPPQRAPLQRAAPQMHRAMRDASAGALLEALAAKDDEVLRGAHEQIRALLIAPVSVPAGGAGGGIQENREVEEAAGGGAAAKRPRQEPGRATGGANAGEMQKLISEVVKIKTEKLEEAVKRQMVDAAAIQSKATEVAGLPPTQPL